MRRAGRPRVVVTAGPTREKIDPVRFISNYSTGVFGYAIARAACSRGCRVTLISGPTHLKPPIGVDTIMVETASEMKRAVEKASARADCVIMTAAVSDWRPVRVSVRKIKRRAGRINLELAANPDILAGLRPKLGKRTCIAGFALETEDLEKNAAGKLRKKGLDMIVANIAGPGRSPFGDSRPDILILDRFGGKARISGKTKRLAAKIILDKALSFNI